MYSFSKLYNLQWQAWKKQEKVICQMYVHTINILNLKDVYSWVKIVPKSTSIVLKKGTNIEHFIYKK